MKFHILIIVLDHVVNVLFLCLPAEGDLYFSAKLQNYTAVEKDEVVLSCELSKPSGDVRWFKDGNEIYPSKNVHVLSDGRKRTLIIKRTAKGDMGSYTCDCGTDKTTADLNIEGKHTSIHDQAPPLSHPDWDYRSGLIYHGNRSPAHLNLSVVYCYMLFMIRIRLCRLEDDECMKPYMNQSNLYKSYLMTLK